LPNKFHSPLFTIFAPTQKKIGDELPILFTTYNPLTLEYRPTEIEPKWRRWWQDNHIYQVDIQVNKPKFYILDMFPYPSGAGLHVGHPLGYIASDIFARYKRLKGYNVLHPMGYDSFGLPAEQYAIQTGQHPAITTEQNIGRYREQLDNIGFSFDWSREVRTSDPAYYKWTQWIFMQLFNHYYDVRAEKAMPISVLEKQLSSSGNKDIHAACDDDTPEISAAEWNSMPERDRQLFLLKYRLTYPGEAYVNWCAGLGSVLSNDEVKDGLSERGGFPVERKLMQQWNMRITAYADRLLEGLDTIDWPESIKDQQRNWIGKSVGASVKFAVDGHQGTQIEVFTTRVDTIYGATFMVLAPEHELVSQLTTSSHQEEIEAYKHWAASRSEIERMAETKKVTGAFTGAFAINPFNNERIPIWIADYVLAGYGTGAVMAVPSGDQRDWNFATHFQLPIVPILDAQKDLDKAGDPTKEGKYINSGMINGLGYAEAVPKLIQWLKENGLGEGKTQYKLRNAVFSRQRYWGEPVPAYWKDGVPYLIQESELPLLLPEIDKYQPTETGEPPLGRAENWKYQGQEYELSTMPGWAGSSWYFYRYMDPKNDGSFCSKEALDYWQDVDFYLGGSEHAVGHLLYSRFWNHFLYDLGLAPQREFAKKLVNQGMIGGRSLYLDLRNGRSFHVTIQLADEKDRLFIHKFHEMLAADNRFDGVKASDIDWVSDESGAQYVVLRPELEKMSKSKFNVVNPDDMVAEYGADCFRMFEMFLGPITDAKPWNTQGISGVNGFLKKFWGLFFDKSAQFAVTDDAPSRDELRILHTCIKKVTDDIERMSMNTCVSHFMIATNDLRKLDCNKRTVLEPLVIMLAPFGPHVAEELWHLLGHTQTVCDASWPVLVEDYLKTDTKEFPVQINGKLRATIELPTEVSAADAEQAALALEQVQKWLEGQAPKKVVFVPGRMINIVV
jgi:leucyl-tRNA synthetase